MNPVQIFTPCLFEINFKIIVYLRSGLRYGLFPLRFLTEILYALLICRNDLFQHHFSHRFYY